MISSGTNGFLTEAVDKLTEPFWRTNASRAGRKHAGIGLSLAKRMAERFEVDLEFDVEGCEFRARLLLGAGVAR